MVVVIIVVLLALALFAWLLWGKKRPVVAIDEKQTTSYRQLLTNNVSYYRNLDVAAQTKFEQRVTAFLSSTIIEGVGIEVTELDRVLIASSAVIPVFGFPEWEYRNLTSVILYPDTFDNDFQFEGGSRNIMGMVGSGYMNGQMLLSRQALVNGFAKNGGKANTAIHEFVHLLDKTDGAVDGVPEILITHDYAIPWLKMMHQEMHRIEQGKSDINVYATTNEAEFLAVAAEYFFSKPDQLQQKHPELYDQLSRMFAQDPTVD